MHLTALMLLSRLTGEIKGTVKTGKLHFLYFDAIGLSDLVLVIRII
jgi:hypothetical protein